ncbi:MAG: GNAT family N-acetyltransferase [Rhodocyclaceae bacterium]|nr:GNAT family N-acetyltransferase [Rhodocyclaceae bacterium]MCE2979596.1 GNAT family N-acetyltransferase [Betaproteobacteria bacterium]MCA3073595.1 GNAT family N-acetyltransferase [Rhodocyclaceae bacterium]MCA3089046.1 GNAT family N-acetyltransferase [Rhodocyclaceae bacterium]MCA3095782.1 GNAT family N-acetyltransferase [Rhodocyclaceae bacterium]
MKSTGTAFKVRAASWAEDFAALRTVRETVFVVEQDVPVELEWDGLDEGCRHLLAEDTHGRPIGCVRLLPDGHIGRMAVLAPWRGRGVGRALLRAMLVQAAASGFAVVRLNAQVQALGFYAREGFQACGDVFDDAGIAHRAMQLALQDHRSDR